MSQEKSVKVFKDKEIGEIIAAEFSGDVIKSVLNKMNPEELSKNFKDINISAIALKAVQDPDTGQIRAEEVKIGINLNFK